MTTPIPRPWPGIGDTLWLVNYGGQSSVMDDVHNLVTVKDIQTDERGKHYVILSNGAVIDPSTLRGMLPRKVVENLGAVKEDQPRELWSYPEKWASRIVTTMVHDPVRCWHSKAEWNDFLAIQRAWNKLASRIVQHPPSDMDNFTVGDIMAAELALFGDIQE